ncbi:hypothetical protein V8E36_007324 [Tilletia maclaganii]
MASSSKQRLEATAAVDGGSSSSSSSSSGGAVLSPAQDVPGFLHAVQKALVPLTRTASQLPASSDFEFHRSLNPVLAAKLDGQSATLLSLVNDLTAWINPDAAGSSALHPASLSTVLAGNVPRAIGDIVDSLLERADINLDEYTGKREPRPAAFTTVKGKKTKAQQPATDTNAKGKAKEKLNRENSTLPSHILNAPIKKPQRLFTTKPDNRAGIPWSRPLKFGKPHAVIPLAQSGANRPGGPDPRQVWKNPKTRPGMYLSEGDGEDNYYFHEIVNAPLPAHALEERTPVRSELLDPDQPEAPTDAGPFTWVDSLESIQALSAHLNEDRVQEIAVDLEHTSYRSYMGLTCLMQVSTRWGDWIVDTLSDAVREHAEILNQSFADPKKIKVLHGADHDILWMQRDLGLYIVGLFDTYQAAVILDYPMKGLAYLLERFCDFRADKKYQLADWRIRPLPKEMLYYAREDTHDLLYIYDCLRLELRAKSADAADAITAVFQRSKVTAARTYAKDVWDEEGLSREGWKSMVVRYAPSNPTANPAKQHWLVRALHRWRDEVARREDESPKYVLSSTALLALASKAPRSPQETLNVIRTGPRELKARLGELTKFINDEIEAFEKHARDEAEALKLAAMGGASAAAASAAGGGKGGTLDASAYGRVGDKDSDESDEEMADGAAAAAEEVGTKVDRAAVVEDVDMFEVDSKPAPVVARTMTVVPAARQATAVPTIQDVSTRVVSSPQVAAHALWSQPSGPTPAASTQGSEEQTQPVKGVDKPKRSLFSLPSGFVGRSLFGGGSSKAAVASETPAVVQPITPAAETSKNQTAPPARSTLFGGLNADSTNGLKSKSSSTSMASVLSSSSSLKASQIRAGFAAAMGGLLGSGRAVSSSSGGHGEAGPSGDYETAEGGRGFAVPSHTVGQPAPIKMNSGRTLSSVTQKLLSRGFHNGNAAAGPSANSAAGQSAANAKEIEDPGADDAEVEEEDGRDQSAFGELVRLKKRKDKSSKGKKRSLDEAVEDAAGPSASAGPVDSTSKKARTEPDTAATTTTAKGFLKPFDLAKDTSILDLPVPAASSSSKGGKGGGGRKVGGGSGRSGSASGAGASGGGGGHNFGPAPRKRDELNSGNRSATFR